jgi:hypothetical protein
MSAEAAAPVQKKVFSTRKDVCRNFATKSTCSYGNTCKFSHAGDPKRKEVGADATGPPPKVAKSGGSKQSLKKACKFGQACLLKDAAEENQKCKYLHDVASAKVQTCSLSS